MTKKSIPRPSILDNCRVVGIEAGRKIYKNADEDIYYTWDSLHGEIECLIKVGFILAWSVRSRVLLLSRRFVADE